VSGKHRSKSPAAFDATREKPSLTCRGGHPIVKQKRLKPWQGITRNRDCDLCGVRIGRADLHWRCEHHCQYDVCDRCYGTASQKAARQREDERFRAERAAADAKASFVVQEADEASCGWGSSFRRCWRSGSFVITASILACLFLVPFLDTVNRDTLKDKQLNFPYPWLTTGFACGLAWALCRLAIWAVGPDSAIVAGSEEPLKVAPLLGFLLGLQLGLSASALSSASSLGMHAVIFVLAPLATYILSVLLSLRMPSRLALLAVGAAVLGGMFTSRDLLEREAADLLPTAAGFAALAALRWVLIQKLMCKDSVHWIQREEREGTRWVPVRYEPPSALVLAARLFPTAAIGCLEAAFWFEYDGYHALWSLVSDHLQVMCVLALTLAIGMTALLIAETLVIQKVSAMLLGILTPMHGAVVMTLSLILQGADISAVHRVGILLCMAACALYGWEQIRPMGSPGSEDDECYLRLESGHGSVDKQFSSNSWGMQPPNYRYAQPPPQSWQNGQPVSSSFAPRHPQPMQWGPVPSGYHPPPAALDRHWLPPAPPSYRGPPPKSFPGRPM